MTLEERIAHHVRMAEAYRDAYLRQGVQDGEAFADAWKFADDGVYVSPYFTGDQVFPFSEFPDRHRQGLDHGGQGVLAELPGLEAGRLQLLAGRQRLRHEDPVGGAHRPTA